MVVLVIPNDFTPVYAYQVLEGGLFNRVRHRRRFGYRLELPTRVEPLIPGLNPASRGAPPEDPRAAAGPAPRRPLFWTKVPSCPRSRKVAFGADYAFEGSER